MERERTVSTGTGLREGWREARKTLLLLVFFLTKRHISLEYEESEGGWENSNGIQLLNCREHGSLQTAPWYTFRVWNVSQRIWVFQDVESEFHFFKNITIRF